MFHHLRGGGGIIAKRAMIILYVRQSVRRLGVVFYSNAEREVSSLIKAPTRWWWSETGTSSAEPRVEEKKNSLLHLPAQTVKVWEERGGESSLEEP